ncbi:hypothetical protein AAG747_19090 [Rapidithrix thailandica]|uniref:Uncharacterized protein n=1 Tax=Rapidithrix thailandica TaxID=413964 RepID=A0AAW9S1Q8_9BACT
MTRFILVGICIVLFMNQSFAQKEYQEVEGFYNLSSFETASGIYLLENKTFFYYASFGNVDLKVFGNYTIQNNTLTIQPDKELMKEFYVYGTTNKIQNDSITLIYKRPFEREFENLILNHKKIKFPEFTPGKAKVSITLQRPNSKFLKIIYGDDRLPERGKYLTIQLTDNINEIRIFHNYYAHMVRGFSNGSFEIQEGFLSYNDQGLKKKQEIDKKTISEVIAFVEEKRTDNTYNRDGKTYQKLNSKTK